MDGSWWRQPPAEATQVPGAAVQAASAADGRAVHPREDPWLGGYTSFSPEEERAVVRRAGV